MHQFTQFQNLPVLTEQYQVLPHPLASLGTIISVFSPQSLRNNVLLFYFGFGGHTQECQGLLLEGSGSHMGYQGLKLGQLLIRHCSALGPHCTITPAPKCWVFFLTPAPCKWCFLPGHLPFAHWIKMEWIKTAHDLTEPREWQKGWGRERGEDWRGEGKKREG